MVRSKDNISLMQERSVDSLSEMLHAHEYMAHAREGPNTMMSFRIALDRSLRSFREQVERHIDISLRELGRTILAEHDVSQRVGSGATAKSLGSVHKTSSQCSQASEDQPFISQVDTGIIHKIISPYSSNGKLAAQSKPVSRNISPSVSRQVSKDSTNGLRRGIQGSGGVFPQFQQVAADAFSTAPALPETFHHCQVSGGKAQANMSAVSRFRVSSAPIMFFEKSRGPVGVGVGSHAAAPLWNSEAKRQKDTKHNFDSHTEVEHEDDASSRSSVSLEEDAIEDAPHQSPSAKRIQFGGIIDTDHSLGAHIVPADGKSAKDKSACVEKTATSKKSVLKRRCSDGGGSFGYQSEGMQSHRSMFGRGSSGDQSLQPLPVWREARGRMSAASSVHHGEEDAGIWGDEEEKDEEEQESEQIKAQRPRCIRACEAYVVPPNSGRRLCWELLGCILILYDVAVIPLQTFDVTGPEEFHWVTRTFWTLDIPSTVMTGLMLGDGSIKCDLIRQITRYVRSWFLLDIVVVSVDWVEVFMPDDGEDSSSVGAARVGKTVRILRLLRLLRLLRMAKLPMIAGTLLESIIRSERVLLIAHMVKLLCFVITLIHFITCIWWGIGNWGGDGTYTWVVKADLHRADLAYQYATSFHWSLTQFCGTMEVVPVNTIERMVSNVVLLLAFVVSAAFISTFTSSMTRLMMLSATKNEMFHSLRRYLTDHEISRRLTQRISRNAHHAYHEFERTQPESDIRLLSLVSEPLRVELHYELYKPVITHNPFMRAFCEEIPPAVRRICHSAVSTSFFACSDMVFLAGECPQEPVMYFVLRGTLTYRRDRRMICRPTGADSENSIKFHRMGDVETVKLPAEKGTWLAEPALWCQWTHCGGLRANTESQLLFLDSHQFGLIAPQILSASGWEVRTYALAFVEYLNILLVEGLTLSDMDEENLSANAVTKAYQEMHMNESASVKSGGSFQETSHQLSNLVGRASAWMGRGSTKRLSDARSSIIRTSILGNVQTESILPVQPSMREFEEGSEDGVPIDNRESRVSTGSLFGGTGTRSPTHLSPRSTAVPGMCEIPEPNDLTTIDLTRDGSKD